MIIIIILTRRIFRSRQQKLIIVRETAPIHWSGVSHQFAVRCVCVCVICVCDLCVMGVCVCVCDLCVRVMCVCDVRVMCVCVCDGVQRI